MCVDRMKRGAPLCLATLLAGPFASAAPAGVSVGLPAPHARASASPPLTSVDEYGKLTLQASRGVGSIDEKGVGWGSFNCSVAIQLNLSGTLVSGRYTAYLQGGSISGTATAHIHSATTTVAQFSGTVTLSHGTGSRAGASGTASFSGTISRTTYAMNTRLLGKLRL